MIKLELTNKQNVKKSNDNPLSINDIINDETNIEYLAQGIIDKHIFKSDVSANIFPDKSFIITWTPVQVTFTQDNYNDILNTISTNLLKAGYSFGIRIIPNSEETGVLSLDTGISPDDISEYFNTVSKDKSVDMTDFEQVINAIVNAYTKKLPDFNAVLETLLKILADLGYEQAKQDEPVDESTDTPTEEDSKQGIESESDTEE